MTTTYFLKRLDDRRVAFAKYVHDDYEQTYTTELSNCDCPGAIYHKTQCKHLKMLAEWKALGEPAGGFVQKGKGFVFQPAKDPNAHEEEPKAKSN